MRLTWRRWAFTTNQVVETVSRLEGVDVPRRTVADLPRQGLVLPSIRWDRVRGQAHPCLWSLDDVVRVRLIIRLRRKARMSMRRTRAILRVFGQELNEALQPNSRKVLIVDRHLGCVLRDAATGAELDVSTLQFRLPLGSLYDGAVPVARDVLREVA